MKKFAFLAVVLLLASAGDALAQRFNHRPHSHVYEGGLGVSFGYAHSAYRLSDWAADDVRTYAGLDGFRVGVTQDFTLVYDALYLQAGVQFTYLNDNRNKEIAGFKVVGDWNECYLSIPVMLKYKLQLTREIGLFVKAGPTIDEGLLSREKYRTKIGDGKNVAYEWRHFSAKTKGEGMPDAVKEVVKPEFSNKLRQFDVMFGGCVGATFFDMLEVEFGYDWGVINKFRGETFDDVKMRRQQLYLGIGVRF